jgi:uncharacterized protein involved in oxidation of intracellular sulfur
MKTLIIMSDPPYGTERTYNGMRLANTLIQREDADVKIFLVSDAVFAAKTGQNRPDVCYCLEEMMEVFLKKGAVALCGACMDARGLCDTEIVKGCRRSSMNELAEMVAWSDKVVTF